jgi:2-polyprenyl-3-methyl-5-hydroxy-6-metoxy-1,4-benzoquinol methylase
VSKPEEVKHRFEWDAQSFAGIYGDSLVSRSFNRIFRKAVFDRYMVTMTESGDPRDKSVLDIGCGSGVYSIELARRGARRVLGIDFSESMLAIARASAKKIGVAERIEFVRDEFLGHDFGDERFDVSIAMGVFDYLEDPGPFLTKMSRLTRGTLLASFPKFSVIRGTARRLRYRLTERGDVFYYSPEGVDRLAESAGIRTHRLVRIRPSGGGVILVGDNGRQAGMAATRG